MKFSFALQSEAKGSGHAVLMAKELIGKRNFVVMYPDDVYINRRGPGVLKQLLDVYNQTARNIIDGVLNGFNGTVFAYGNFLFN